MIIVEYWLVFIKTCASNNLVIYYFILDLLIIYLPMIFLSIDMMFINTFYIQL